jgi:two-component system sensor histidine kinase UhpB
VKSAQSQLQHQADLALDRFARLRERSSTATGVDQDLIDEALEELAAALHELHASTEELREQNEQLLVAETRVAAERRRYHDLFDFGPDGYLVTDHVATIRAANRMAEVLLGAAHDGLIGKPLPVFAAVAARPELRRLINAMANGQTEPQALEILFGRRGSGQFPAALRVAARRRSGKERLELRWSLRDVSAEKAVQQALAAEAEERRQAEESLRQSETRFRHLVEHATDIVYEIDQQGRFTFCNDHAVQRILGYVATELIGRPLIDLVPALYRKSVREFNERQLRQPGEANYFELPLVTKDERIVWFGEHVSCLKGAKQPPRLQAVCRDITVQVERVQELQRSGEQWRGLSTHLQTKIEAERARIAHDIHDELGAALTTIRMELSLPPQPEEPRAGTPRARPNAKVIRRVDAAIETMRRICSDLRPSLLDNMGLCAAIEWLAQDVQERAGIRCEVSLSGLTKEPDPDKGTALFRIVQEAVTNAIRHADASALRIRQEANSAAIVITISDNGRGITPEELAGRKSFGIVGMQERAKTFGGKVRITGGRTGTRVTVRMPAP